MQSSTTNQSLETQNSQQQSPQTENHQRQVRFKNVPRKPPQPQQITVDMTGAFELMLKTELKNTEKKIIANQDDEKKANKENLDRLQDQISDLKQIIISNQAGITKIIQGLNTMSQRMQIIETQVKNVHGTTSILPHLDR